jgi:oligopeptide transport system ATP-binding protein
VPDPKRSKAIRREILQGDVPSPVNPPAGCVFSTRCRFATQECMVKRPVMEDLGGGHHVACHHFREIN